MHPTKYAVRCIVHSTVLMSDISCVCKRDTKRDISTWSLTEGGGLQISCLNPRNPEIPDPKSGFLGFLNLRSHPITVQQLATELKFYCRYLYT